MVTSLTMCLIKQRAKNPKQKALRRQQILLATKERFNASVYEDVNLNHIAEDIGITKAALYRYFRNKETLFLALYVESLEQLIASSDALFAKPSLHEGISDVLIQNPTFCKLSAILHTILERNLKHDEALAFKLTLLELMQTFTTKIKRHPDADTLSEERLFTKLMLAQQALIGAWHMTHPNGAIAEVLENPPLTIFKQNFEDTLKNHLKQLF